MNWQDKNPIVHICNSLVYGGGEEHVRTILKYLHKRGVPVAGAAPEESSLFDILKNEGIAVYPFYSSHKFDFASLKSLCSLIKKIRPTIIHTHNRREDLIGALAAKITRVPAVTTIHDRINMDQDGKKIESIRSSIYHVILRTCFKQIITVSQATYDDIRTYAKVPEQKLHHVINGLDLDRVVPSIGKTDMRKQLGLNPDNKAIAFVARIRGSSFGKKGIVYLIDAMQMLIHNVPKIKLFICGEDTQAANILKKLCYEKGILGNVRFLGYRKDSIDIINACDILVCPSLFEGLPRVVLESMSMGVPVVGSNVDGIPEVIDNEHNGLLVEPKDSIALTESIKRLLIDDKFHQQCSQAAQQTIKEKFTAQISAQQTEHIYETILDKH